MFLNFNSLRNGLSRAEEDETARILAENSYTRVMEAEDLQDVEDVSTEDLADVMMNIHEYTREISNASMVVGSVFSGVRNAKRVATARLL